MASVTVYQFGDHRRSRLLTNAMFTGIRTTGDRVRLVQARDYREPDADVAVFYGMRDQCLKVFRDYQDQGLKVVYIDLGYWARHDGGRYAGYHKIVVNGRHPTAYFQRNRHPNDRALRLGMNAQRWRKDGQHIIVAGMSPKGAEVDGFKAEQWERATIADLKDLTKREIIYRPKPSWKDAKPIAGAQFSPREENVVDRFPLCHAVVTHHSNVAVDALVYGIPTFCWEGVAAPMSLQDLAEIENPWRPENRDQWIADIAYTQWNVLEMTRGKPWRQLKIEGLIP